MINISQRRKFQPNQEYEKKTKWFKVGQSGLITLRGKDGRMFLGESRHSLDPKGRLTIPARFRAELGSLFYATKGLDRCIFIYTIERWRKLGEKFRELPLTKGTARAFTRLFFSGASELEMDKQGRVLLPSALLEYANIDKESMIIGVGDRIELWSVEGWTAYEQQAASSFESIAETLFDFGL